MGENLVKKLRGKLTSLAAAAAIFAIIGAAGIFVIKGLVISGVIKTTGVTYNFGTIMLYSAVVLLWDLTRLGGFGMFVCGVLAVVSELLGGKHGKAYAFVMLAGSVCGLVSAIQFSVSNIFRSLITASIQVGISGGSYTTFIDFPCIMAIISSVTVLVSLAIKSMNANRVYVEPQYPPQGYPQYPQNPTMPYASPIYQDNQNNQNNQDYPNNNNTPMGQ